MRTHTIPSRAVGLTAILLTLTLLGCDEAREQSPDDVGTVRLAVMKAPSDAVCLRVTAAGSARTVVRSFDLTPGQDTVFLINQLPVGAVAFSADVFAVACATVNAASVPNWIADPVTVNVTATGISDVSLLVRRNGRASVGVDFEP